ncbi:hypothetical protein EDC96DRAFT_503783 [Choanephora cucurbitarum]|nr:hypothetical protein EDC96DRAFT_503783 [Choanephora cucurbitarum]
MHTKRTKNTKPKLFQCTGYGDCNMVFTRSEHLARHARKHTGEKPFLCIVPGCSKAFSRFDNMMQHTQTHRNLQQELVIHQAKKSMRRTRSSNSKHRPPALCSSSSSSEEEEDDLSPPPRRRLSVADLCNPPQLSLDHLTKDEFEAIEALDRFHNSFQCF